MKNARHAVAMSRVGHGVILFILTSQSSILT